MTPDDYVALAMRTIPPGSSAERMILNGALGLAGEAGEVADYVKKHIFHNHPFDKDSITDELGDILWYIALFCYALDESLESILKKNIAKLVSRYPNGFSSERSINRGVECSTASS